MFTSMELFYIFDVPRHHELAVLHQSEERHPRQDLHALQRFNAVIAGKKTSSSSTLSSFAGFSFYNIDPALLSWIAFLKTLVATKHGAL